MKPILFTLSFLLFTTTSYSQEISLSEYVKVHHKNLDEDGWTTLYSSYVYINSETEHLSDIISFEASKTYGAFLIVEDCPHTPYFAFRDADGEEYEEESESVVEFGLTVAVTGFECSESEVGQYIVGIESSEFFYCYFIVVTKDFYQ